MLPCDRRVLSCLEASEVVLKEDLVYDLKAGSVPPPRLQSRNAWLRDSRSSRILLCNGREDSLVNFRAAGGYWIPRGMQEPLTLIEWTLPFRESYLECAEDLIAAAGPAGMAWWGITSPPGIGALAGAMMDLPTRPAKPPKGLPVIQQPDNLDHPACPGWFGWINYWSAESASRVGLPSHPAQMEPFDVARRLNDGSWVLRLTSDPFDVANEDHMAKMAAAYEHFKYVGGRSAPSLVTSAS